MSDSRARLRASLACIAVLLAGVTCTDSTGPLRSRVGIALAPSFSDAALTAWSSVVSSGLVVDNIHIKLDHADGSAAKDTVVAYAGEDSLIIEIEVEIKGSNETLGALVEMRDGTLVLFSGEQDILAVAGAIPQTPPEVKMGYAGPGATVTSIDLAPADSTIIAVQDSVVYRPTAKDQNNQPVADFALLWSLTDSTIGTISSTGVFRGTARGQTRVIARTHHGVRDTALVTVVLPATKLVVISGNAQTGAAGGTLPQPVVIEAQASDNLPVPGVVITFVPPPNTTPAQTTFTAGSNGRISVNVPVNTVAGASNFQFTSLGLTTASLTATAIAGAPAKLAMNLQPSATAASGAALATQPKVQLQDAFGNSAAVAGKPVAAALTTPAGRALSGTTTVNTDANGVATFTDLAVSGPAGSLTLRFTHDTLTPATSSAISLGVGAAAKVVLDTRPSATAASGVAFAQQPVARITDASGNTVTTSSANVTVSVAAGYTLGGTLSVAAVNGIATFSNIAASGATGSALLTFNSTGLTGDTATVSVSAGVAAKVKVVTRPSASANSGAVLAQQPVAHIVDAAGNLVTSSSASVTVTASAGYAISGSSTVSAGSGVVTFIGLAVSGPAGNALLTFASSGLASDTATVAVSQVAGPPATIAAASPIAFVDSIQANVAPTNLAAVVVKDAQNVVVPGIAVKFRLHGGLGSKMNGLADTVVTVNTDANGVARLTSQRLRDSIGVDSIFATTATLNDTVTFLIGVLNGAPHHLAVLLQPTDVEAGDPISVVVVVQDRLNNITSLLSGTPPDITIVIRSGFGTTGALLSPAPSALTQSAAGGIVSFAVSIDLAGTDYALTASSPGFTSVHTSDFEVTAPAPEAVTWVNPAGGNWSVASNWSTGVVPTTSDVVKIDLSGTYTVTLDVNVNVKALCIGGATGTATVTASSKTITIADLSFVYGTGVLSLTSSTINGTGGYSNEGLILAHGTSAINVAFENTADGVLRVQGQTAGGAAALTFATGFTNDGVIELTSANSSLSANLTVTSGTLTIGGSGEIMSLVGTGGSRSVTAQINNLGLIETQQNLTLNKPDADHVNSGSIISNTANMIVTQTGSTPTFTNMGSITLGSSRDISISGGESIFSSGTVSGPLNSTFIVSGSALSFSTTTILVPINFAGASTVIGGAVTVPTGQTLRLLSGVLTATLDVQSGGTLIFHGAGSITGSVLANNGTIRVQGQTFGSNGSLTIANGFTNSGLIELTSLNSGFSSTLNVTSGTLTNASGATIRTTVGTGGSRTLGFVLDNQGTLDIEQPATLNKASAAHASSGVIDLTAANLTVSQSGTTPSFTNTGSVTLGAGITLTLQGTGAVNLPPGGTITGTATSTLVVNSAALTFTTQTVSVPLTTLGTTIVGESVTIPDGQTLTLLNGALTEQVTIEDGGTLRTLGTVSLTEVISQTNSMIQPRGQTFGSNSALTIANGFTNNGTIELISAESGFSSTLNITSGTLVNAPGGFIRSMIGTGGSRTLGVQLDNQGSVDIVQPTTLAKTSATHLNSGTIFQTSANLTITQSGGGASFTNSGTVTLGANRDFTITGGTIDLSAGTVGGPATSRLVVTGATLGFSTATVNVPMTLTTTSIVGASVTIPSLDTLTLQGGDLSDNVTISSGGLLLTHGVVALNGLVTLPVGGTLTVRGQTTGSNATLTIANGFSNNGTIRLISANSGFAATLAVTNGPLINEVGAVIHSGAGAGGARVLQAELDNRGTLDVDQPLTIDKADAAHVSSGAIDVANNLTVTQSGTSPTFTNSGTINVLSTQTMTVTGGALDLSAGLVTGTATSTLVVTGSALTFTPSTVTIPLTMTSTTVNGGGLTIGTSQSVTLLGGGLSDPVTINSGGTLLTHGNVSLTGTMTLNGNLRVQGQSNGSNAFLSIANGFTNNGFIELTSANSGFGSTLAVTSGTLTNNGGAMIHSDVGTGGARTIEAQLVNNGTLDVDQPLVLTKEDASHYNGNFIDLTNAQLTVTLLGETVSFGNGISGTITVGASKSLIISGGTVNLTGTSVVSGPESAKLQLTNVTLNFTPPRAQIPLTMASVTIPGGTVTIANGQTVTLVAATVAAAVTVQSGGLLRALATNVIDDVTVDAGGELEVVGGSVGTNALLTITNDLQNDGSVILSSENSGFSSTLAVTNGTFTNSADATIASEFGTGGSRTIQAELNNQGTIEVNQALTLSKASAQHSNTGIINLTSPGTLTVTQTGTSPTFTNNGSINLNGRTMTVTGGVFTNATGDPSGTIQGPGVLNVSSTAFTNHGNMSPGGILTLTGNYVQDVTNGGMNIEMSSGTVGTGYGQLAVSGTATLSGSLNVNLNDFLPTLGQEFTIMTFTSSTGTFSTQNLPDLTSFSLQWQVQYNATNVKLKLIAFP